MAEETFGPKQIPNGITAEGHRNEARRILWRTNGIAGRVDSNDPVYEEDGGIYVTVRIHVPKLY